MGNFYIAQNTLRQPIKSIAKNNNGLWLKFAVTCLLSKNESLENTIRTVFSFDKYFLALIIKNCSHANKNIATRYF